MLKTFWTTVHWPLGRREACIMRNSNAWRHISQLSPRRAKLFTAAAGVIIVVAPMFHTIHSTTQHPRIAPFSVFHSSFSFLDALHRRCCCCWCCYGVDTPFLALCCDEAYARRCISGNCGEILPEKCVQIVRVLLLLMMMLLLCCCSCSLVVVVVPPAVVFVVAIAVRAIGRLATGHRGIQ